MTPTNLRCPSPSFCCNHRLESPLNPSSVLISFHQHRQYNLSLEMTNYLERVVRGFRFRFFSNLGSFFLVFPSVILLPGATSPSLMKMHFPFPLDRLYMYVLEGKCIMRHQLENIKRRSTPFDGCGHGSNCTC